MSFIDDLYSFLEAERIDLEVPKANTLAMSFVEITRYRRFLGIIRLRHDSNNTVVRETTDRMLASFVAPPGGGILTPEQQQMIEDQGEATLVAHLDVESFYLFAKILFDKVAHSLEYYFGTVRKRPLVSHDNLVKNWPEFSKQKGIVTPIEFLQCAERLKAAISDHRDYYIAHQLSPRAIRSTVMNPDEGSRIATGFLYPTKSDKAAQTEPLPLLEKLIDEYLHSFIGLLTSQRDKSQLRPSNKGGANH
jgi:hypothetical protein